LRERELVVVRRLEAVTTSAKRVRRCREAAQRAYVPAPVGA
jgi:hypothetical protein